MTLQERNGKKFHQFIVPVRHYTDFNITTTCVLATTEKVIWYFDDPRYFLDPKRVNVKILWFAKGYVEYKILNQLLASQHLKELEISMELGSEAPGVNSNWPSDISFIFIGIIDEKRYMGSKDIQKLNTEIGSADAV